MADTKLFEVDTEVVVLSAIMKNPDLMYSVDGLRFYMFSSTPHQTLFGEFEDLLEKQLLPDPTLVYQSLEAKSKLDDIGGKKYFESLLSKEIKEGSFEEFVKIIISAYKARALISITSGVNKSKLNSTTIDDEIYQVKKALDNLTQVNGDTSSVFIGDMTKDAYEEIRKRAENPGVIGHSWGNKEIDRATGGKIGGDVVVIAGRPGMGKTAVAINSIYADALNGIPSLSIQREMRKQQLIERLLCIDTGIPNTNIRLGVLSPAQMKQIHNSLAKFKELPIYMDTSYKVSDPYYLESTINKYKNKYGIQVVYLDYLQLLAERDERQTQEIGKLTRMFKILSNELNITSVLLSQLNRNIEQRENKRPLLSDMKQSGAIEEDADFVIGLYRDEVYAKDSKYKGLMEYLILKHRNGPPGTVTVKFNAETNKVGE